jgi:hypothetical protein
MLGFLDLADFKLQSAKNRSINGPAAKSDLALLGAGANKLYWLLPPLYYHSFTKHAPHDIEQYAVLIPYPDSTII